MTLLEIDYDSDCVATILHAIFWDQNRNQVELAAQDSDTSHVGQGHPNQVYM
jgi:hypothetical protein